MNRREIMNPQRGDRVPRTRGDEPSNDTTTTTQAECSPHTRG